MFQKKFQIRGPSEKHLSDRQKFLHQQNFRIFWPKIVFWGHQKLKKLLYMMGDDQTCFFLELMYNTQICLAEISDAVGPLTMTLLRRKVIWNHEKWKKRQKVPKIAYLPRIEDPLCLMSANTFNALNSLIRCWFVFFWKLTACINSYGINGTLMYFHDGHFFVIFGIFSWFLPFFSNFGKPEETEISEGHLSDFLRVPRF